MWEDVSRYVRDTRPAVLEKLHQILGISLLRRSLESYTSWEYAVSRYDSPLLAIQHRCGLQYLQPRGSSADTENTASGHCIRGKAGQQGVRCTTSALRLRRGIVRTAAPMLSAPRR